MHGARPTPPHLRWLRQRRAAYHLGKLDPIGAVLTRLRGPIEHYQRLGFGDVRFDSSILDVGCGDGAFLRALREVGFTNLEGVDPLTREVDRVQEGFVIRATLGDVRRQFEFVHLDDSFEHMADPVEVFTTLRKVCAPRSTLCIDVPVRGEAWRLYQTDWVQLDAPRHFYLHTKRSIETLARGAGFSLEKVVYNSTSFQFWGSEQYRRDIPLTDPRSHGTTPGALFSREQIRDWEERAQALNRVELGDHATFFLRPS